MPRALIDAASARIVPPVDADSFALLLKRFIPLSRFLGLAVSGGPDSMALAFCSLRWARVHGHDCIAFIVDHGLRPDSSTEAATVKARLESIGLRAEILPWTHEPVGSRLHEKAREARYRLLTEACRRHGASDLLIAHHREDQAETVLMRLAKGSGVDGLAGIAAVSPRNGIRLLRPFLQLPKESLTATCAINGIAYVSDPSNASPAFARGRLRRILPLLESEGLTADRLTALAARAAEASDAIDFYARAFLRLTARCDTWGAVTMAIDGMPALPRAVCLRALALALRHMRDKPYPPEREIVGALADRLAEKIDFTLSLYGCLAVRHGTELTLLREPSAASDRQPLPPGGTILWDGRWHVSLAANMQGGIVGALGNPPHDLIDRLAPGLRKSLPRGRIRATLPALWQDGNLAAIPTFSGPDIENSSFHAEFVNLAFP
jgi:tRNA(Ile)-lysidine synthase